MSDDRARLLVEVDGEDSPRVVRLPIVREQRAPWTKEKPTTLPNRWLSAAERDAVFAENLDAEAEGLYRDRPRDRTECVDGPRPCPWFSCRYHLGADVTEQGGLQLLHVGGEMPDGAESCALDYADRGGAVFEDVGDAMGISKQRVKQIESDALHGLVRGLRKSLDVAVVDQVTAQMGRRNLGLQREEEPDEDLVDEDDGEPEVVVARKLFVGDDPQADADRVWRIYRRRAEREATPVNGVPVDDATRESVEKIRARGGRLTLGVVADLLGLAGPKRRVRAQWAAHAAVDLGVADWDGDRRDAVVVRSPRPGVDSPER